MSPAKWSSLALAFWLLLPMGSDPLRALPPDAEPAEDPSASSYGCSGSLIQDSEPTSSIPPITQSGPCWIFADGFESGDTSAWSSGGSADVAGLYHLDEGSGTVATDSAGTNHGVITDAIWTTGPSGSALQFGDPESSRVDLPRQLFDGFENSAYIEAWINPTAFPTGSCYYTIFRKRAHYNDWQINLCPGGQIETDIAGLAEGGPNGGYLAVGVVSPTTVPLGQWTRVASWYDGTRLHLYIGDPLVGVATSAPTPLTLMWNTALCDEAFEFGCYYATQIGANSTDGDEYTFQGSIDEILVGQSLSEGKGRSEDF